MDQRFRLLPSMIVIDARVRRSSHERHVAKAVLASKSRSFEPLVSERYPGVEFPPLPPRGDLDVTEVLAADYFFS